MCVCGGGGGGKGYTHFAQLVSVAHLTALSESVPPNEQNIVPACGQQRQCVCLRFSSP